MEKLSRENEAKLVRAAADGDAAAYQSLWDAHASFVARQTHRYAGQYARLNLAEDVASAARFGFALAVKNFDPARKTRFVTLLNLYLRRYVLDFLKKETRLNVDGQQPLSLSYVATDADGEHSTPTEIVPANVGPHPGALVVDSAWEASAVAASLGASEHTDDQPRKLAAKALAVLSPQLRYVIELRYVHLWDIARIQQEGYARPVPRERVLSDLRRAVCQMQAALR